MSPKHTLLLMALAFAGCKEPLVVESYLALVHLSPTPGSGAIPVETQVVATFSEPLVGASVDTQSVWLEDIDQLPVVANIAYDGSTSSIVITPEAPLEVNTTYRVFLTSKIKGSNSGQLGANITSDFTTGGWVPTNELPVANAGEDVAAQVGQDIQFDGSSSVDPEGAALSYSWRLVSLPPGSNVSLEQGDSPMVSFTADVVGEYVAGLTVNDGTEDSSEDFALARVAPSTGAPDTGSSVPPDTGTPAPSDTGLAPEPEPSDTGR